MKMNKFRKMYSILLAGISFTVALVSFVVAKDELSRVNFAASAEENIVVEERGVFANIVLKMKGGNGVITATVENTFTLFPSTIRVYVELYSSETYQESYASMTLEKMNIVADLNMGETLSVSVSTGGEQKYWRARMRYKFDDRDWISQETDSLLYSAQGELLSQ